jgi:predicted Zn-dependent protease
MAQETAPHDDAPFSDCDHRLQIVQGYYELGMIDDARTELAEVEAEFQPTPNLIQMRILLLLHEKEWSEAHELSAQLRAMDPEGCAGYIHGAYSLHEMKRTREALDLLSQGPSSLKEEALYYYNLGCYRAALGDVETARECLHKSFDLDGRLVAVARKDPDLHALKDSLL